MQDLNFQNRENCIRLTLAVYRVTDLLPEPEPLRYSIRRRAIDILTSVVLLENSQPVLLKQEEIKTIWQTFCLDVEVLSNYFKVAQDQLWIKKDNFLLLQTEYSRLREKAEGAYRGNNLEQKEKKSVKLLSEKKPPENLSIASLTNKRHRKILEALKQKSGLQVKDIELILPEVSKRTLRRDFAYLFKEGWVKRIGNGNSTVYKLAIGH